MALLAVCCPDKFRGSLTAPEAAGAMACGLRDAGYDDEIVELPLADGGEGTLDALIASVGGEIHTARVTGPLGVSLDAEWGLLRDGTAVVEMARASGLALVAGTNDPIAATTRGTGELIALAAREGARRIVVGVGGSATVDGGLGALEALGWELPAVPVVVACDVTTAFLDAARVYGPQKGADAEGVATLTRRLELLARTYADRTGVDVTRLLGGGAAGGLAGGLAALGATLGPGFDLVAEAVGLDEALAGASLVLTGEGKLDATSLAGKVVGGVLGLAPAAADCVLICGQAEAEALSLLPGHADAILLVELTAGDAARAQRDARALVREAAASAAGRRR